MSMVEEQSRIIAMMERGATFDDVEEDVINQAPCDDDEKAALWLFAFALRDPSAEELHARATR